jgi:hypothetical protein
MPNDALRRPILAKPLAIASGYCANHTGRTAGRLYNLHSGDDFSRRLTPQRRLRRKGTGALCPYLMSFHAKRFCAKAVPKQKSPV